jgi:hypothetical protein
MRRRRTVLTLLLALSVVIAACGDDDAQTTATDSTGGTDAPTDTAAPATPTTQAAAPSGFGDLDSALARYENTPLRTTYLIGEGDDREEIIIAQDPTATPPIESITLPAADTKIIISEGTTTLCDGSSSMCFELPGAGGESLTTGLLGPFAGFLSLGVENIPGVETSQEPITVAGRDGICFSYEPPDAVGSDTDLIRQCVDGEFGFTLLMQASAADSDDIETVMELTEFVQPTPEDFAMPYPVTSSPTP